MQKIRHQKSIFPPCSLFDRCMVSPHRADTTTLTRCLSAVSTDTYWRLHSTLPEAKWITFALPHINLDRQTCGQSHLSTLYLSTCHAVKNGVFLTPRCLTTVNVQHPGGGVATLLMCESPPYPSPCCFSSWDPWIRGACWFLLLHPPNPHSLCSPKAGPSLQEAGRGRRLYQIAECEQRTMRNWNEITKSIWFIWDLSLGLLGESECINPLWELIPCLVIIQASLKYALCWR